MPVKAFTRFILEIDMERKHCPWFLRTCPQVNGSGIIARPTP